MFFSVEVDHTDEMNEEWTQKRLASAPTMAIAVAVVIVAIEVATQEDIVASALAMAVVTVAEEVVVAGDSAVIDPEVCV